MDLKRIFYVVVYKFAVVADRTDEIRESLELTTQTEPKRQIYSDFSKSGVYLEMYWLFEISNFVFY